MMGYILMFLGGATIGWNPQSNIFLLSGSLLLYTGYLLCDGMTDL